MKLNEKFNLHKNKDGIYVVPTASAGFHGLIRGNKTVMTIIDCLAENTTEEDIVRVLMEKYDGREEDIRADAADVISKLKEIGAIDDQ